MENYLSSSRLIKSDSEYEIYSFDVVENFYKILENCHVPEFHIDFHYNVITLETDNQNHRVFNIVLNETDSRHDNADSCLSHNLIEVKKNKNKMIDLGIFKNDRIIVKDNCSNENKTMVSEKFHFNGTSIQSFKRKLSNSSTNMMEDQEIIKKRIIDQDIDSSDEFGSRLKTQPKVRSSFSLKKKVDVLDELKLGKTISEVSEQFRISEKMIQEFQKNEIRIRNQLKENITERDSYNLQQNEEPLLGNSDKEVEHYRDSTEDQYKSVENPTRIIKKEKNNLTESSKCILKLNFEIHKERGKLVFGNSLKSDINSSIFSLELPKNHPDIPKTTVHEKSNLIPPVPKTCINNSSRVSNLIPKIKVEPTKTIQNEIKIQRPLHKSFVRASDTDNKVTKNEKKVIEPVSVDKLPKTKESEIKNVQKIENDSILKKETKPVVKKKLLAAKNEAPAKITTPFRYLIVDPLTVDFKPKMNIDPEIKFISTNIESEDFINEVRDSYDRYKACLKYYEKYNMKREDLRKRAQDTTTEKEINELYKEFYRLLDEEKLPFFVALEKEVTVLHDKLSRAADLMGIKLD